MATTTSTPVTPSSYSGPSPSHRRHRGRQHGREQRGETTRRGGGRGNTNASSNESRNLGPDQTTNNTTESSVGRERARPPLPPASSPDTTTRGSGGRGRARAGRRRGRHGSSQPSRVEDGPGRRFEGQLTRTVDAADASGRGRAGDATQPQEVGGDQHGLRADAPMFVPGEVPSQVHHSTSSPPTSTTAKSKGKQPQRQPQRTTQKSTADDMATRIHEDISHAVYECPICTSELGRRSKVWSCHLCWTVFHLTCVRKWANNEGSVLGRGQQQQPEPLQQLQAFEATGSSSTSLGLPRQWRCPGCNLPHDILPSTYSCWCEKETDPRSLPGLPPHSCGQTCSKPRSRCPHPCDLVCHAGPCPPCKAMGPIQPCFCGRHESMKKCEDTDYENGWSCGEVCGEMLPCLEHTCPRPCHEGLCGECEERVDVRCYCGKMEKDLRCGEREEEHRSVRKSSTNDEVDVWVGSFKCGAICGREYDCGVHSCEEQCHPQREEEPHCPFSPDTVSRCACEKTLLADIPSTKEKPRTSCQDAIPNCNKPCEKVLPCGHSCPTLCHSGPCPPCLLKVDVKCRCGRNTFKTLCPQGAGEPPMCFRACGTTMSCGRHSCPERCCPGGQKSQERQATKRKLKSLNVTMRDDDIEAEHICTRTCDRLLKCGKHHCPDLCHKGACGTCREGIFEEIACHCGRTVLYPPLPCGTELPSCHYPCERPKACGHPQTQHNCHPDNEPCPKCPYLMEKKCLCGKKTLKNQPCWHTEARCGLVCGALLKCGSHNCKKDCHRPGDCEDATGPCQQACGKIKKICGHPCTDTCHAPLPCPETTPCQSKVTMTCACGRLKQEKRCNASRDKNQPRPPSASGNPTSLKCDDECARLQRNRSLASALNVPIDQQTTVSTAVTTDQNSATLPYSEDTLDVYVQLSSSSTLTTLQNYESTLHSLAASPTQRSVRFQPAKKQLRAFTHSLAADWGFMSESFDPDPNRHVLVHKPGGWMSPMASLGGGSNSMGIGIRGISVGECVKMRERERMKEREARRAAAEKARMEAETIASTSGSTAGAAAAADGDGWAQVVSRSKRANNAGGEESPYGFGDVKTASPAAGLTTPGRFDKLVLRSGLGMGRAPDGRKKGAGAAAVDGGDVADNWEEEVEKEEREGETAQEHEHEDGQAVSEHVDGS